MNTFGNLLKTWRKKNGLSQQELADKCAFSQIYISLLETDNKVPPPPESVLVIAKALHLAEEEAHAFLDAANSGRLSHFLKKTDEWEVSSVVRCLVDHFNKEQLINLSAQILHVATTKK